MTALRRSERTLGGVLLVMSLPMSIGGIISVVGGADPDSEVGRLDQPLVGGYFLLAIGAICGAAGVLVLRRHSLAFASTTAAIVALAGLGAFRLLRFGVIGLGDLLVPVLLVVLLVRSRSVAPAT